jgi:phospholipase C
VLGELSKERGVAVDGLRGCESNTHGGRRYDTFRLDRTAFPESPCHDHDCIERQIDGGDMGGFVAEFARRFQDRGVPPGKVMGYYGPEHVPTYDVLAREFGVCDQWYCSLRAATWPNRFFLLSGQLPRDAHDRPILDTPEHFSGWDVPCLFDHLTERNVAWRYYEHDVGFIRLFHRYKFDVTRVIDVNDEERGFFADAAAGRLPAVSFIDPNFVDIPGMTANDDHPPADIREGQKLIAAIYNALAASPSWPRVLFVITYDEHGGFYDHVSPPLGWGVRVPAFVISPRVPRGLVAGEKLDHTAIVQTISRRFMRGDPPNMGPRAFASRDLGFMLTETSPRTDAPREIAPSWPRDTPIDPPPDPEPPGGDRPPRVIPRSVGGAGGRAMATGGLVDPGERDFRSAMAAFRAQLHAERALRR